MLSLNVCSRCLVWYWRGHPISRDLPEFKRSTALDPSDTVWLCHTLKRTVRLTDEPPTNCPHVFEHAVAAGVDPDVE